MNDSVAIVDVEITVLDYETTGTLRGFPNEPWQIGLVTLREGRVDSDSMFESLLRVDVNRPFNPHAPGRHDLMRDEIAIAPAPLELWSQIQPRLVGIPLCAHNISTEKKMTRAMAPMHKFGPWIDTLKVARKIWPGLPSYALEDLIAKLSLKKQVDTLCPGKEPHDALYDAVASATLLEHLLQQDGWGNVTLSELADI